MFPTDVVFIILYIAYFVMFGFLIFGLLKSKNKIFFKWNFLIFGIYLAIMITIFLDSVNFKSVNAFFVLLYGVLFLFAHVILMGIIKLIKLIAKK